MTRLINGSPSDSALAQTRAIRFGDGVFRTLLVWEQTVVDLERQLIHLKRDAKALHLEMPDQALIRDELSQTLEASECQSGVLRITLSRCAGKRGYRPDTESCDRIVTLDPLPEHARHCWQKGISLGWSPVLLATQPLLAGIKHLNRLEQVLASRDWQEGLDEMLMCDSSGRLVGGTRSNVFFVIDNIVVTPELCQSGVAGMMRQKILEVAARHGRDIEVGLVAPDELRHASECFVSNSLIGIWPVRKLGGLEFAAPGPRTTELMNWLDHPWRGV